MTTTTAAIEWFTVQQVSRRTGLSDATLRYYERVGLVDRVPRDESSGHRRYDAATLQTLEALSCLRATGMGIEEMRRYRTHLRDGDATAERELFERHVARVTQEIAALELRREYLEQKVALWTARERDDEAAEGRAVIRLTALAALL